MEMQDSEKHPMTLEEMSQALAYCGIFDGRIIPEDEGGAAIVAGWHEILGRFTLHEVMAAIRTHYTKFDRRIMPSDIYQECDYHREQWFMKHPSYPDPDVVPPWAMPEAWIDQCYLILEDGSMNPTVVESMKRARQEALDRLHRRQLDGAPRRQVT